MRRSTASLHYIKNLYRASVKKENARLITVKGLNYFKLKNTIKNPLNKEVAEKKMKRRVWLPTCHNHQEFPPLKVTVGDGAFVSTGTEGIILKGITMTHWRGNRTPNYG